MNKAKIMAFGMALTVALGAGSALADGDAAKGEKVFRKCKGCHTVEPGKHRTGPSLAGVVGRKAGTAEGFTRYKGLEGADFTWNEENLNKWLENPKKFLGKRTSMSMKLRKEDDRKNVIAYLKTK
jgi:cytochrome c